MPDAWTIVDWQPPAEIDPECTALCKAINEDLRGVITVESCCGHGREPYRIWCRAKSLTAAARLAWWLDGCHSGEYGWRLIANTDCSGYVGGFLIEGPVGAFDESVQIGKAISEGV